MKTLPPARNLYYNAKHLAVLSALLLGGCATAPGPVPLERADAGALPKPPLYHLDLELDNWKVRVEVPSDESFDEGTWRLRSSHAFLMTVPVDQGAPRPGTPAGGWLVALDEDPEPELVLWSRPATAGAPGTLQLWDLMSGKLYARSVPAFELPEGLLAAGERITWDGTNLVREVTSGTTGSAAGTRFRWNPKEDGWQPVTK